MELLQSLQIIAEAKEVAILSEFCLTGCFVLLGETFYSHVFVHAAVVVHQPSPELLEMFDHLVVMNAGKITFQGSPQTRGVLPGSDICRQTEAPGPRDTQESRSVVETANGDKPEEMSVSSIPCAQTDPAPEIVPGATPPTSSDSPAALPTSMRERHASKRSESERWASIKQTFFLVQRLQMEHGWEWVDVAVISSSFTLVASLLLLEPVHTTRAVLMTMCMVCVPQILFANKAVRYGRSWQEHRLELDDRLVRIIPFHYATEIFAFSMPVVGIALGSFPVMFILGWPLRTGFTQAIFSGLSFAVVQQIGRISAIWFRGKADPTVQVLTLVILLGFAFSSIPIASWKFPLFLRWMINLSVPFWGGR